MYKHIIALACVIALSSFTSHAQLENVAVSEDSSFSIDKVYAGVLSIVDYRYDSSMFEKFAPMRVGAAASWRMTKRLTLKSFVAWQYDPIGKSGTTFQTFWMQYKPHRKWLLETGVGPTLSASQHRPHPVTYWGQFEPSTKGRFPGVAPMASVKFLPNERNMIGIGVGIRESQLEYQATATIQKNLQITTFYQVYNKTTGVGLGYTAGPFSTTMIWKSNDVIANLNLLTIHKKQNILLYTDFGYALPTEKVVRFEAGVVKTAYAGLVKATVGLGWSYDTKSINSYLLIGL